MHCFNSSRAGHNVSLYLGKHQSGPIYFRHAFARKSYATTLGSLNLAASAIAILLEHFVVLGFGKPSRSHNFFD